MALIGLAHFTSHFIQLTLPPLFPVLKEAFAVSYVALGLVMTAFYAASGLGQAVCGFLVDRWGARRVLLAGASLQSLGMGLAGLAGSYDGLVAGAVLGGLGNAVYHPADYAILTASVDARRVGRAFSVHALCGTLGYAAAPATVLALVALVSWRVAVGLIALAGLGVVVLLASQLHVTRDHRAVADMGRRSTSLAADVRLLMAVPIVAALAYFALLAMAQSGVQTFAVAALAQIYATPLDVAGGALTGYLMGIAAGIMAGGLLADLIPRHGALAAVGLAMSALFTVLGGSGALSPVLLPVVMAMAGLAMGVTSPSRDMLVRATVPAGAAGKVYGFVYSGLDIGSLLAPMIFGWMLDHDRPRAVFAGVAVLLLATILTVVQVRRGAVPTGAGLRSV
jgi:MFS transporter, FSR family, fosmidomycin resistance protein